MKELPEKRRERIQKELRALSKYVPYKRPPTALEVLITNLADPACAVCAGTGRVTTEHETYIHTGLCDCVRDTIAELRAMGLLGSKAGKKARAKILEEQ